MPASSLSSYLNAHLAGSVAALQLIDHLLASRGKPADNLLFEQLKSDIQADQETLRLVIAAIGDSETGVGKVAAWAAEKASWLKIELSDAHGLGLLEALEALFLGITGKRGLWEAMAAVASNIASLSQFDFQRLMERADAQAGRVNRRRLDLAREVLIK
jgi:hypothetical protein